MSTTTTGKDRVKQTLITDNAFRHEGVQDDLFTLENLDTTIAWDFTLPTLMPKKYGMDQQTLFQEKIVSKEVFMKTITDKIPILKHGLDLSNVLIAGGFVSDCLLNKDRSKDVDMFIYGLATQEEATARVHKLVNDIIDLNAAYKKKKKEEQRRSSKDSKKSYMSDDDESETTHTESVFPKAIRHQHCLNLECEGVDYQIIFRLYKTKSEILHGFDLGSSAVGFDGKDVLFTSLSKFSYENIANIIDPSRRSTTYEKRLEKYYQKGFRIILPDLNIKAIPTNSLRYGLAEVCDLPHFVFTYRNIKGNRIYVERFAKVGDTDVDSDEQKENSVGDEGDGEEDVEMTEDAATASDDDGDEYDESAVEDVDYVTYAIDNEYVAFHYNIRHLIHQDGKYCVFADSDTDNENIKQVRNIVYQSPFMNVGAIHVFYDRLQKQVLSNTGKIDIGNLKKHFVVEPIEKIVQELYIDRQASAERRKYLIQLIARQKADAIEKFQKMSEWKVQWVIENPGRQWTSSFNPIIESDSEWYGRYYKKAFSRQQNNN